MALSTCENIWLKKLVLHQCPHVLFPSHSQLVEEVFHAMITKSMDIHVLQKLASVATISISFDLWMFGGGIGTFALVINYLSKNWEPMNANFGMFEVNEITDLCMG
jgi:hypothetical protein